MARSRLGTYREAVAQAAGIPDWAESLNEEIWLSSPEAIKKFLDKIARATMALADKEK